MLVLLLSGCLSGVTQVAGTGAVYTTRCSADMDARSDGYYARCEPAACDPHFKSTATNQVVVALDPGNRVLGYAERVCIQDLSNASALFQPVVETPDGEPAPATPAADGKPTSP